MLILQVFAYFQQLRLLVLGHILQALEDMLIEVIDAFVDWRGDIFVLDNAKDYIPNHHALQKYIQFHRRFGKEEGQKLLQPIHLLILFQDL